MQEINDLIHNSDDIQLIKDIARRKEYIDMSGQIWKVSSENIENLLLPIERRCRTVNTDTKTSKYDFHFYKFFWLRQRDFADLSIDYKFNYSTINFHHKHDIRTKVLTLRGKPSDLTKFTKNY